jgi:spermidine synthase
MNRFDKLLSYLYPINICETSSDVNPFLEVIFRDSKYQLNSFTTNYSYGGLYDLFKLIFRDIALDWDKVDRVLILGFGTGCVVPIIQKYKSDCQIVGVEKDPKVIDIGKRYFELDLLKNTDIVCDGALNFITHTHLKFDLIIIDVYVDNIVPCEVETISFLQHIKRVLSLDGLVIFNKLVFSKEIKGQIPVLKAMYNEVFDELEVYTFMKTGEIFIAKKNREP